LPQRRAGGERPDAKVGFGGLEGFVKHWAL
jgi:hypothetical protein